VRLGFPFFLEIVDQTTLHSTVAYYTADPLTGDVCSYLIKISSEHFLDYVSKESNSNLK
jgi:hypothetical protein